MKNKIKKSTALFQKNSTVMNLNLSQAALRSHFELFYKEDDLLTNFHYTVTLPQDYVTCLLKIKSPQIISGMPFFIEAFRFLKEDCFTDDDLEILQSLEGKYFEKKEISFKLPFNVALTGERIALNLLQKSSSITTTTQKFVRAVEDADKNIAILDTRKTTPGLRFLEKYAVKMGGGHNHRFGQTQMWMVKDNHKNFFGGIESAVDFFKSQHSFYNSIEVEVHSLEEFEESMELGIKYIMLDNFSPELIKKVVSQKPEGCLIEVSGGVNLDNIKKYLIDGVDAISIGSLTYAATAVDISLKIEK